MFAISLNFKTANVALRESFAFDEEKTKSFLYSLKNNNISQCVYLSTCNRCELYGVGDVYTALKIFTQEANVVDDNIKSHIFVFDGVGAVRHLFRVCCGFESMVVGEDEILGQIKKAFSFSQSVGTTDYELNTIFKSAITSAKKIKTKTLLSKSSVSVATLVAGKCHKFKANEKSVLLIGASGDIGNKVLKNLLSYNEFNIFATTRDNHIGKNEITIVPYDDRYKYVDSVDIIISATKSPHFTIVADKFIKSVANDKHRLIIDLAVPRDVDSDIANINGVTLMQIDDFKNIAKRNSEIKLSQLKIAEEYINDDIDDLLKELLFHSHLTEINNIKSSEIKHFIYDFRDNANAEEFESFLNVLSCTIKDCP